MHGETSEIWSKRVERWKDSGLTAAQFASEIGVKPKTLTYWKWRLKKEAAALASGESTPSLHKQRAARFIEVPTASTTEARIEVVLGDGTTVRVIGDVAAEVLHRVLSVLQARR